MKRMISVLLVLLMLLGMVPAMAFLPVEVSAESDSYTIVQEKTAVLADADTGTAGVWYINGSAFDRTEGAANYIEITQTGCDDTGALHIYQDNVTNSDMSVGMFLGGQAAGTYTVKLNVKGDLGYKNQTCKFYPYGCFDQAENLHTILGTTEVADWTEISYEVEVSESFYYLIFSFSKYNWKTDFYVDNLRLLNSSGVDVLAGAGNFYTLEEVTCSSAVTGQYPVTMDTGKVSESYSAYAGEWTPFCHYTAEQGSWQGTWPAWDSTIADSNYGEIVANGYRDAGSLHLKSASSRNAGVAIDVGMTSGETYTLGLWVKGSASSNKMLGLYGNGDGTIIGNPAHFADVVLSSVPASWTYVEKTFTADRSNLILVANDWGVADLYIDNITLTDESGNDLLEGCGDFYYTTAGLLTLETENPVSAYNAPNGQWSAMYPSGSPNDSTWPAWDDTHYGEIVPMGNLDNGALHLVSAASKNTGVGIGVDMVEGESYTLGLWVKGTSNSGRVLLSYANGDPIIIGASEELTADWSYYEVTLSCTTTQLNLVAADWGNADIYIDNITLKDSSGTDLLAGCGNFLQEEQEEEEPTQPEYQDPAEEGWIGRDAYTQLELGVDYDYSFAVLGDIQHITDYTPDDLHYLFDYIIDNKDAKNIQFVFGMGDSTNDLHNEANNLVEWQLVQDQFFRFNGVLPYTVIRGNHDNVVRMNTYLADPEKPGYMDQLDGFYQEGNVVNVWKEFSVGGVDYLNIVINYESSDSVLEWASDVIEAHPNHRVIVGTHVYLLEDGSYDNEMNPGFGDAGIVNNAQQVWDKLISQHENIFMVLCGHNSTDDVLVQHKTGVHGNQITEIRVDSQYTDLVYMLKDGDHLSGPENGVGMVTLLYFKEDGTQVAVEHYSALRGWYREMQTFEIEPYEYYGWRYDASEADSYNVDVYTPATGVANAPDILQNGLGGYGISDFVTENDLACSGTGASILPDYNMDLGTHTYALHSGTRAVDPSSTYTISYKIRGLSENTRMWPQIHFCRSALGGSDTWESQWQEPCLQNGPITDWKEISFDIHTDGTTSAIEIYFIANGGEVYIDDFSIVKKQTPADRNLLPNGDFEEVSSGVPTGWYAASASVGTVAAAEGLGVDGSTGLQVTQTAEGCTTAKLTGGDYALSLEASAEYTLTYSFKAEETGTQIVATLREKAASADAALGGYRHLTTVYGTAGQWITQTETFTTAEDHTGCNIWLNAYGNMVIDNVSLVKVSGDGADDDSDESTYGVNIVTNGDFEQGTDGEYPTGFYTMKTGGVGTVEKVSGAGVDGSAAVRIEPRPGYILKTEETIAVSGNTEYTLSYMVRIPGKTTDLTPVIRLYDAGGAVTVLTGTEAKVSGAADWKQVTYTFTTAADTAGVQVCLLAYGGRADVDDLSLTADGSELMVNGDFCNQLEGFAGEFVQGLQEGTVISTSSARPDSLIVEAKAENGVLNAYEGETLLGTVDWLYGELEHKLNLGLYISDGDTADAAAVWVTERYVENLWILSDDGALLDTVLAVNENVRAVLSCTADSAKAENCAYAYVLVDAAADVAALQAKGIGVILSADTVTREMLESGADAILTTDALAAIRTLESIPMADQDAQIHQWNLSLGGDIGVSFWLKIDPQKVSATEVSITVNGETVTARASDLTAVDGLYLAAVNVAAAQMTDEITVQILVDGVLAQRKCYTIRQYADWIMDENNGCDDVTRRLVAELLNYGSAAQTYFDYRTDDPAGVGLSGVGTAEVPAEAETEIERTGGVENLQFYGASLLFQSQTAVRFYFTGDMTGCSVTANGQELTVVQKDALYYADVTGISPDALEKAVTVTVTRDGQTLTVSYSPMNYIVRMSEKGTDSLKALLKAMYNYHLAAEAYVTAQEI